MKTLQRDRGRALILGGFLRIACNAVFTPLLPSDRGEEALRTSWPSTSWLLDRNSG